MPSNGVMKEIQSLLAQDKSSAEVIALGFNSSTVYKVQRQLRREAAAIDPSPTKGDVDPEERPVALEEPGRADGESGDPADTADEIASLRNELAETLERMAELEVEAADARSLRERVAALEAGATSAEEWQEKLADEEQARRSAESLAEEYFAEAAHLREANQELRSRLESLPAHLSQEVWTMVHPLIAELEELRPLRVWAGHSCNSR